MDACFNFSHCPSPPAHEPLVYSYWPCTKYLARFSATRAAPASPCLTSITICVLLWAGQLRHLKNVLFWGEDAMDYGQGGAHARTAPHSAPRRHRRLPAAAAHMEAPRGQPAPAAGGEEAVPAGVHGRAVPAGVHGRAVPGYHAWQLPQVQGVQRAASQEGHHRCYLDRP
ncbi:unnamed protein product [Closterium sp. NIES-53]